MKQLPPNSLNATYFVGLISSLVSLTLFILLFYIFPVFFFGLRYQIPAFITRLRNYLSLQYSFSDFQSSALIFFTLLILAFIFGYIAYRLSNRMDNEYIYEQTGENIEEIEAQAQSKPRPITDVDRVVKKDNPTGKIVLLAIVIILGLLLISWLISV